MNFLSDIITYVRRIVKTPSNASLSDNLIIDYINRFYINDVDARLQLFDLKKSYKFQTTPGVDKYNMPLYDVQTVQGNQSVGMYPVYQGFLGPAYINGIHCAFYTLKEQFYSWFPNYVQNLQVVGVGDGTSGPYNLSIPILSNSTPVNPPVQGLLRGHVDMAGIIATGTNIDPPVVSTLNTGVIPSTSIKPAIYITSTDETGANVVITDSGQFLSGNVNYGLLMKPGNAPFGYQSLGNYDVNTNTINYLTGEINVTMPVNIPAGVNINVQCYYFQTGLPRGILYYDNTLTLRMPPSQAYMVELQGYLSPAAFLNSSDAIPFGYMSEYIARGAARKILSDTGDIEQFQFYEPLFIEQEALVWKRSQRQFTSTRTPTIYSQGLFGAGGGLTNSGQL